MKNLFLLLICVVCTMPTWAYDFEVDGIFYNIIDDNEVEVVYKGFKERYEGNITIPATVTESEVTYKVTTIGQSAFLNSELVTSVDMPNSITTIKKFAFQGALSLTSLNIPESVTSIEEFVFVNCPSLAEINVAEDNESYFSQNGIALYNKEQTLLIWVSALNQEYTIPESVTHIGVYAFYGCKHLSAITISQNVHTIDILPFLHCSSLAEINVAENNASYSSIDGVLFNKDQTKLLWMPDSKTGKYIIPENVDTIDVYAFSFCSLSEIILPETLLHIGVYAFLQCNSLTSIIIPENVDEIESSIFWACENLEHVAVKRNIPLTVGETYFWTEVSQTTLHVPAGSLALYEEADGWRNFGIITEEPMPTDIKTLEIGSNIYISNHILFINSPVAETITIYSLDGNALSVFDKPEGEARFPLKKEKEKILIIKTHSMGSKKVYNL